MKIRISPLRRLSALGAAGVLALAACAGPGSTGSSAAGSLESMDPLTLTFSSNLPASHSTGDAQRAFAKYLQEKTDGKVTVEHYFNASLMPAEDVLDAVPAGTADVSFTAVSYFPQELPTSNWVDRMGALQGFTVPTSLVAGAAAINDLYMSPGPVQDEWAEHGLKVLAAASSPTYRIFCNTPVNSVEDARGLRTRVGGGIWLPEVQALGMKPVSLSTGEVYQALQRGVIDCASFSTETAESLGVFEVAKYVVPVNLSHVTTLVLVMNLDKWNSLPPDVQKIIEGAGETYWLTFMQRLLEDMAAFPQQVENYGLTITDATELNELLAEHQEARVTAMANRAPDSLTTPKKLMTAYKDYLAKWQDVLSDELGIDTPSTSKRDMVGQYASVAEFPFDAFSEAFRSKAK